jgi:hypothetical protein
MMTGIWAGDNRLCAFAGRYSINVTLRWRFSTLDFIDTGPPTGLPYERTERKESDEKLGSSTDETRCGFHPD